MFQKEKDEVIKQLNSILTTDGKGSEEKRKILLSLLDSYVANPECVDLIKQWTKPKYRNEN